MGLPAAGGVILVDKPAGPTSHDVVAAARRGLGTARVGHTGTLDPFATGLLLLCVGPATRLVEFLIGLPKEYLARVRLGVRTTTDDREGAVEATSAAWQELTRADLEAALEPFRGRTFQTPPQFSAKKVGGEAAHYRVRRGESVSLAPVEVDIFDLELLDWRPPELELRVGCSSGTYIRALARDLGEALGTGAHLSALRRTAIGESFHVKRAVQAAALDDPAAVAEAWMSPADALAHLPSIEVGAEDAARLAQGQVVVCPASPEGALPDGLVVVRKERELVAVAEREGERLRPRKVFQAVGSGEDPES